MMATDICISVERGVMTLTIARAQKKNAINNAMFSALADALEQAASAPDVRVVLFNAEGENFTAGNDMADFQLQASNPTQTEPQVRRFSRNLIAMQKPVIAAVKGCAVGIGTTLLLHCDLVYIANDARLSAPFVDLGLIPELASTRLLTERIGYTRTFEFFALGRSMDGIVAAQLGIATQALPVDEVDTNAVITARTLAGKSPQVLGAMKRLMRRTDTLTEQLAEEMALIIELKQSPQVQAAVQEFLARRK